MSMQQASADTLLLNLRSLPCFSPPFLPSEAGAAWGFQGVVVPDCEACGTLRFKGSMSSDFLLAPGGWENITS